MNYGGWAHLYDDLVTYDQDLPFFEDLAREAGPGDVVALMAGTGRLACRLAGLGLKPTCVDRSAAMLAVLREKLSRSRDVATIVRQDIAAPGLERRFALACIAFNSFEEIVDDDRRRRSMERLHAHVAPGGRAVITLHNPKAPGVAGDPPGSRELTRTITQKVTGRTILFRHAARLEGHTWSGTQSLTYADSGERIVEVPVLHRHTHREEFAQLVSEVGFEAEALFGDYRKGAFDEIHSEFMIWNLRHAGTEGSPSPAQDGDRETPGP